MTDQWTTKLILATASLVGAALSETVTEMAKELRRYSGSDFEVRLDKLKANAIRRIENTPVDEFSESEQLMLIEQTRLFVAAIFDDARQAR